MGLSKGVLPFYLLEDLVENKIRTVQHNVCILSTHCLNSNLKQRKMLVLVTKQRFTYSDENSKLSSMK